jgi:phosphoribosylformimino-5-aminoimidazole carboxamide ribotide isomerase
MLGGFNKAATLALANAVSTPVIVSGGIASMADIDSLMMPDGAILDGAIIGRALYDGRIAARAALALTRGAHVR